MTIFSLGLTLGPFTLWNDAFINFPLTVLLAEPFIWLLDVDRAAAYFLAYIFTNVLGLALMAIAVSPRRWPKQLYEKRPD